MASRPPTTGAFPLDVVGELHRQRSKLRVRTTAKRAEFSTAGGLTRTGSQRRHVGTSQIRRESTALCSRDVVAITGFTRRACGTHLGRPSTNIDRRAPDVLDHARVDEPTRTESCSASPTSGGPRSASTPHMSPAQDPSFCASRPLEIVRPDGSVRWHLGVDRTAVESMGEVMLPGSRRECVGPLQAVLRVISPRPIRSRDASISVSLAAGPCRARGPRSSADNPYTAAHAFVAAMSRSAASRTPAFSMPSSACSSSPPGPRPESPTPRDPSSE